MFRRGIHRIVVTAFLALFQINFHIEPHLLANTCPTAISIKELRLLKFNPP
jgi:hypothetical protein